MPVRYSIRRGVGGNPLPTVVGLSLSWAAAWLPSPHDTGADKDVTDHVVSLQTKAGSNAKSVMQGSRIVLALDLATMTGQPLRQ